MKLYFHILTVLALCIGTISSAYAEECLKMGGFVQNARAFENIKSRISRVFMKADLCFSEVIMPARRIKKEMKKGNLDGEFVRDKGYAIELKDHVIHVPTPLLVTQGFIVTRADGNFKPKSLADVNDKVIGVVNGVNWIEALIPKLKKPHRRNRMINLISLLKAKRIDGFLVGEQALQRMFALGFAKPEELHKSKPILRLPGYIILHKRHSRLVDRIDRVLRELPVARK